ncbi:MAG TPA: UDP-N-acetyl-alpha-D-muramoyl-L-alanyl-L-glutamate epimerase [Rhodanobacteraceae bacterium]|nr:UDP-N-acetyl-alpha-D-muramoyl-L-alanyl-L-glutamate epimerase [Rhodanobacteraceae bacterium]
MNTLPDPRQAKAFRFARCGFAGGVAELVYAFDDGPELVERISFPDAPAIPAERRGAFDAALRLLHLVAGVSYYKAGVPERIEVATGALDAPTAGLLDTLYFDGLAEFAFRNKLDLRQRIAFPRKSSVADTGFRPSRGRGDGTEADATVPRGFELPRRTLVPIGGGKDSLVVVEALKHADIEATATWVGASPLIAVVAARTGLPVLNIGRELSPTLFEYNRMGAWNGHIPVTAINSAILVCAAIVYGFDAIAFANERSASAATLEYEGRQVNHQWSKGWVFEQAFAAHLRSHVAASLDYFSLLRPFSELAVTRAFAKSGTAYFDAFSSCNRNFRILGPKPSDRWCGQCPKCHFVFLALAPFLPKPRLLAIFGRNLLDDEALAPGFDALVEYHDHKPFECVGEASEARAALATLAARPEWREDALVAHFREDIMPQLDAASLPLEPWLAPAGEHGVPERFRGALDAICGA